MTFHNGKPLTAAVEMESGAGQACWQSPMHAWKLKLLESIDIPDDHVIKPTFAKPFPFLRGIDRVYGPRWNHRQPQGGRAIGQGLRPASVGTSAFTCLALHKPTVGSRG